MGDSFQVQRERAANVKICAVIPSHNNADTIDAVVRALPDEVFALIIDDGSDVPIKTSRQRCEVLRSEQNRGKAEALKAGFSAAAERGFTHAVTLDADGQAADWFRVRSVGADRVVIAQDYSYDNFEHTGVLRLTAEDGTTRDVPVVQAGNDAASTLQGDTKLTVASASDNQHQSGEDASASIDGDFSTLFHSPWSGSTFPVVLTYNFGTASHVDYAVRVHVHENRDVSIVSRPALLVYPDTSEIGEVQPVL